MAFEIKKSTQFHINELVLVTKGGNIDISKIYEEINIFDSLLTPVMTGNIMIRDANGLSSRLIFDGSESILMDIAKDKNSDIAVFKKSFRVFFYFFTENFMQMIFQNSTVNKNIFCDYF